MKRRWVSLITALLIFAGLCFPTAYAAETDSFSTAQSISVNTAFV